MTQKGCRRVRFHAILVLLNLGLCIGVSGACNGFLPGNGDLNQNENDNGNSLQYYTTCGDVVCSGYSQNGDLPLCSAEQLEGAMCSEEGLQCDPVSDCNQLIVCASTDPKDQPGGCPISLRDLKTDLVYLDKKGLEKLHYEITRMPLATFRYKKDAWSVQQLGFIIDDNRHTPAVRPEGNRVSLYGYTSMAVAALQVQQKQIDRLRTELDQLRQLVAADCHRSAE